MMQTGVDVLLKSKLLGSGGSGSVYSALSLTKGMEEAIKFSHESEFSIMDLELESRNLHKINTDHSFGVDMTGLQEDTAAYYLKKEGEVSLVLLGKMYQNGDLGKQVTIRRLENLLDMSFKEIKNGNKEQLTDKILASIKNVERENLLFSLLGEKFGKAVQSIEALIDTLSSLCPETPLLEQFNELTAWQKMEKLAQMVSDPGQNENCQDFEPHPLCISQEASASLSLELAKIKTNFYALLLEFSASTLNCHKYHSHTLRVMGADLIEGLMHMHHLGMIHRDIKPQNFFVTTKKAVIGDFGNARLKMDSTKMQQSWSISLLYDTVAYRRAMDLYSSGSNVDNWFLAGKAYDIRGMGLSLYEIFTGQNVPEGNAKNGTYKKMFKNLEKAGISPSACELLIKMCQPLPIDINHLPETFPIIVTDEELATLELLLRRDPKR